MDKIKKFEAAIISILSEYEKIEYANINGKNSLIVDRESHRYLVLTIGWDKHKFVHDCPMHFDIINHKIWIQRNMTEWDLGKMLEDQGVLKSDIVLGFLSEKTREFSDYAVA
jgi:hypothetical protein